MRWDFTVGNLLDSDERVIAHGCNTMGAYGAGIAGQIARRWPQARRAYGEMLNRSEFRLGSAQLVDLLDGSSTSENKFLFNLGTQRKPGRDASIWGVFLSFANMAEVCAVSGFDRVAIPRIGCGIGGLSWIEVRPAIQEAVERSSKPDLEIIVYDFG